MSPYDDYNLFSLGIIGGKKYAKKNLTSWRRGKREMVVKMKNITLLTVCCAAFILGFSLFQSPTLTEKDFGNKGSLQGKFYLEPGHRSYHNSTKRILQGQRGLGATPSAQVVIQVNETILVMIREIREKLTSVNVSVKPFDIPCNKKSIDNTEDLLCMVSLSFSIFILTKIARGTAFYAIIFFTVFMTIYQNGSLLIDFFYLFIAGSS